MSKKVALIWRVIRIVDRQSRHVIYEKVYVAGKGVMSRTIGAESSISVSLD